MHRELAASEALLAGLREPVGRDGRLEGSLPCRHCGYDLRGRSTSELCPECGAAVVASLRYYLRYSPPRWVRDLAGGVDGLCLAAIATAAAWALAFLPAASGSNVLIGAVGLAATVVIGLAAMLLAAAGVWSLTMRQPGAHAPTQRGPRRVRWLLRAAGPLLLLLLGLWVFVSPIVIAAPLIELVAVGGALLGLLVMAALLCKHLAALLRRVPERRLVQLASGLLLALVGVMVTLVVGIALLAMQIAAARALNFTGAEVRWRIGGTAAAGAGAASSLPLVTFESEALPGTGGGATSAPRPGVVTVWTTSTIAAPVYVIAGIAALLALIVVAGGVLLFLTRRAFHRAARQAAEGERG